jgi:hypothetical protein
VRADSSAPFASRHARALAVVYAGLLAALTLSAAWARLPGWNPESLWNDDLELTSILRAGDLRTMLSVPAHSPPGFVLALWLCFRLFGDPEWSTQLIPFLSGIAAVPILGTAVRALTRSRGLGLAAAALAAENPLLAHYTVFVRPYAFEFLLTGLLLWAAALLTSERGAPLRAFVSVALLAGIGAFFSVTSVFLSCPVVHVVALGAWIAKRPRPGAWLLAVVAYDLLVATAFVFLRDRANPRVQQRFRAGFLPLDSIEDAWGFLVTDGVEFLARALPSWRETTIWDPATTSWPLVFAALGFVWLAARRATRELAVVIFGFLAAVTTASALGLYPLGLGRTDIYAFPVVIALSAAGAHAVTHPVPGRDWIRRILGVALTVYALIAPVPAAYWNVNDARLIDYANRQVLPSDGLILSPAGTYLAAVYGHWPVDIAAATNQSNGTRATIVRDRTLNVRSDRRSEQLIDDFLAAERPERIWYVAFRTGAAAVVVERLSVHGYSLQEVERTARGRLYLAVDQRQRGQAQARNAWARARPTD